MRSWKTAWKNAILLWSHRGTAYDVSERMPFGASDPERGKPSNSDPTTPNDSSAPPAATGGAFSLRFAGPKLGRLQCWDLAVAQWSRPALLLIRDRHRMAANSVWSFGFELPHIVMRNTAGHKHDDHRLVATRGCSMKKRKSPFGLDRRHVVGNRVLLSKSPKGLY